MKKKKNILVTGGAGFIGSNLVEALLLDQRVGQVKVLDNLSTGFLRNIEPFFENKDFQFIEGDIRNFETCMKASVDVDLIAHQAALGSVPRSIKNPIQTNEVNIVGTLNVFHAAVENEISRVVFAASSSTYGDSQKLPKVEDEIGKPLSPYAVTKLVNEIYADVYSKIYNLDYIGLRYFNVFGPRQDPNGAYAAVIPLFFEAAINGKSPKINGDGSFSRDFTYVGNAIEANLLALFLEKEENFGSNLKSGINNIYNVACGKSTTLIKLWESIQNVMNTDIKPLFGPVRVGDIPHSLADISKSESFLGYTPKINLHKGLKETYDFYMNKTTKKA